MDKEKVMEENTIEIREILYAIRKRYKLILLIMLIPIAFSAYKAFKMKPTYVAKTKLFIGKEGITGAYSTQDLKEFKGIGTAYIDIFNNEDVIAGVLKEAKINLPVNYVRSKLNFIQNSGDSPTLEIRYTSKSLEEAEQVIKVIAEGFKSEIGKYIVNSKISVLDSPKVSVVNPNRIKTILIGFILGAVIALGVVFLLDYLDNSVKDKEQLEKTLPIPVIGEIPIHD